ncbi:MAG: HAD family hydrolase [Bacteroidales bacterium]|nr:HAD family hydrolase [Bacteroidales bacterium]
MIETIIFDFDGVILDSMGIKSDAFARLYLPYGEELSKIAVEYHESTAGMSRYKKFVYLHKKYLNIDLSEKDVAEIDKDFSAYVMERIVDAPFVDGVLDFLEENFTNYKMFVSSGTPLYELEKTVRLRGLEKYFVKLFGSPRVKTDHISEILTKNNLFPQNVLFIGDGIKDKEAANSTNVHFIARIVENSMLKGEKYQINDFSEIQKVLQKINLSDIVC